jgi:hypothetical protein
MVFAKARKLLFSGQTEHDQYITLTFVGRKINKKNEVSERLKIIYGLITVITVNYWKFRTSDRVEYSLTPPVEDISSCTVYQKLQFKLYSVYKKLVVVITLVQVLFIHQNSIGHILQWCKVDCPCYDRTD